METRNSDELCNIGQKLNDSLGFYRNAATNATNLGHKIKSTYIDKNDGYIFDRNGGFDLYSFSVVLLCAFFTIGFSLSHGEESFNSTISVSKIIFFVFMFFGSIMAIWSFLTLLGPYYHEKWIFEKNRIICRKTLFSFVFTKTMQIQSIRSFMIEQEKITQNVFFSQYLLVPIFCVITPWRLLILDENGEKIVTILTMRKADINRIASDLATFYGDILVQNLCTKTKIEVQK
jgi:hypothetical protein